MAAVDEGEDPQLPTAPSNSSILSVAQKSSRDEYDDLSNMTNVDLQEIEGIDRTHKRILASIGIENAQNLATANPLLLIVDTPFGLYQIMDWIDQAVLLTAVGLKKTLVLRRFGIRTAHDLANISERGDSLNYRIQEVFHSRNLGDFDPGIISTIMRQDLHFRRLDGETLLPMFEALDRAGHRGAEVHFTSLSILGRFGERSLFILPLSILTLIGSGILFGLNIRGATRTLTASLITNAYAQSAATGPGIVISQGMKPVIASFLGAGIFMTLCVCLYAGFIAKKPSAKAAEAVKSILSFSFGIVTSSLAGL